MRTNPQLFGIVSSIRQINTKLMLQYVAEGRREVPCLRAMTKWPAQLPGPCCKQTEAQVMAALFVCLLLMLNNAMNGAGVHDMQPARPDAVTSSDVALRRCLNHTYAYKLTAHLMTTPSWCTSKHSTYYSCFPATC